MGRPRLGRLPDEWARIRLVWSKRPDYSRD
jgi:hypothetical protein